MMGEKHSQQTNSQFTPPEDTQANAAPVVAENNTQNAGAPEDTHTKINTLWNGHLGIGKLFNQTVAADVVAKISDYAPEMATANRHSASSSKIVGADQVRNNTILKRLLQAVAYGMESKEANEPIKTRDAANLFKYNLFAKDLIDKSPEFLLARGDVTDWAGRTFKHITAFEYALWAKDFKMIEMMLRCIPETEEGDEIRAALLEQYKQVTDPTDAGGGLTYTHTYNLPNLDRLGIPDGTTTSVTEKHTENHFDITPLCAAYEDYHTNFANNIDGSNRTHQQRLACWIKLIGALQRLLPVHVLQRYCGTKTDFHTTEQGKNFHGLCNRSTYFENGNNFTLSSIFGSYLSYNVALNRFAMANGGNCGPSISVLKSDLAAVRKLNEISTKEIEKIPRQLSQPRHASCPRR